jgi:alkanesulfonate monooxygenase SsuD/methylene tetrahydromethanopterin reductase-like flavin-dependent oxidoreductase (luciferase family)
MVEEGVEALRALLGERSASFEDAYYKFRDVELVPRPYKRACPSISAAITPRI